MNPINTFKLTSPKEVQALLQHLGHRPNRGLGQNYLIDANILDIITHTAAINTSDTLLEIGPGLGALTERLLKKTPNVVAIEKDPKMVNYLKNRFPQLRLIEADALNVDLEILFKKGINKVVANLPYSVGTRLVIEIIECLHRPQTLSLTLQKEVAERIVASAGNKQYGILAILIGLFYHSSLIKKISPTCFLPPPKVWSSVIQLEKREKPHIQPQEYENFKKLIKTCFSQRRKQIGTLLRKQKFTHFNSALKQINISPSTRPETINLQQWVGLYNALYTK